jgi:hypothetical protein
MHPRMTSMHAEARDAFTPSLASAGARAVVHASAELAASPALSHAVAERQQACPWAPSRTRWERHHAAEGARGLGRVRWSRRGGCPTRGLPPRRRPCKTRVWGAASPGLQPSMRGSKPYRTTERNCTALPYGLRSRTGSSCLGGRSTTNGARNVCNPSSRHRTSFLGTAPLLGSRRRP